MKRRFLISLFVFISLPILSQDASTSGDCDRVYQTAIRFVVDTPVAHPFTINAEGGQVIFSRGNLQYCPLRDEWRFALRQFDRCGNGKQAVMPVGSEKFATPNYGITTVFWDSAEYKVPCNNLLVSKRYGGWIDLFPWGTSGHGKRAGDSCAIYFYPYDLNSEIVNATYNTYGYGPSFQGKHGPGALSNNIDKLSGTNQYFDWGYKNVIREYSGCTHTKEGVLLHAHDSTMYRPGVWRTLTIEEWGYLFSIRKVNGKDDFFSLVRLKYGNNATDTVTGVVIYPDDFMWSHVGISAIGIGNGNFTEINATTWNALEQVGCVFLPSAGARRLSSGRPYFNETDFGRAGFYWTATAGDASNAPNIYFYLKGLNAWGNKLDRNEGLPVRLVQDYTPPQKSTPTPTPAPEPEPTFDPIPAPPKKLGVFSVGTTKKVNIAPGNLQYQASTDTWRFAEHHYDRCGGMSVYVNDDRTIAGWKKLPSNVFWDSSGYRVPSNNLYVSETYGGWIDLFAWGTSGVDGATPPYIIDIKHDYFWSEWGQNQIGEYAPNTWRTPTGDEWEYLLKTRKVDGREGHSYVRIRYGNNATDTVSGWLFYPDDFRFSIIGFTIPVFGENIYTPTEIDAETWSVLYDNGCAFLPACSGRGNHDGQFVIDGGYGLVCYYWSSTQYPYYAPTAYRLSSIGGYIRVDALYKYWGYSVRLVKDVQ